MSEVKRYIALGAMFEPDKVLVGGYVLAADYDKQAQEIERLTAELEQVKSRKSGLVLPERGDERGSDGKLTYEAKARNSCLDEVVLLNSSAVSAGISSPETLGGKEYRYREALKELREALEPEDWMGEVSMHAFIDAVLSDGQEKQANEAPPPIPATQVLVERELPSIVTEALMGMIAAVTSTTPPPNEPPPPFIQAAIDRAVARIRAILSRKGDV
ncbi:hypothetical protein [Pseudomonas sp.]|uniref:hypothetical protein n=1 Tax=Pseudomonas sp. TaxID=306 RepID=UPI00257B118C|nr:hypothetical protein [Pseudomonas sp.]